MSNTGLQDVVAELVILQAILNNIDKKEFPKKIEITNPVTEVTVKNFPEVKNEVKVINFPEQKEYPTEIKVINFPEQKEYPTEIKVSNIPEEIKIKEPNWLQDIILTITDNIASLASNIFKIDASKHQLPKNAIATKLVDENNKVIPLEKLVPKINIPAMGGGPYRDWET